MNPQHPPQTPQNARAALAKGVRGAGMSNPTKPRATLCQADGCRTLVLGELLCWKHRGLAGEWAEAQHIRDELEQQDAQKQAPKGRA